MTDRTAGVCLIAVAAFLFIGRLIAIAHYGQGHSWNNGIAPEVMGVAWITLIAGYIYLIWAGRRELRGHDGQPPPPTA